MEIVDTISPRYKYVGHFYNDMALVVNNDNKYGAINEIGQEIVECKYEILGDFNKHGLAIASLDGKKYGIINKKGEIVVPFKYDSISTENKDIYFKAESNTNGKQKSVIYDAKKGKKTRFLSVKPEESIIRFDDYIYDIKGDNLIRYKFLKFNSYDNIHVGTILDETSGKQSAIIYDKDFNIIDRIDNFKQMALPGDNIIFYTEDSEYGIVNRKTGEYVSPKDNIDFYTQTRGGVSIILYHLDEKGKSTIFMDKTGHLTTLPYVHADCIEDNSFEDTLTVGVSQDEDKLLYGLYKKDGTMLLPCEYDCLESGENYRLFGRGGKYGYSDLSGNVLINAKYDSLKPLSNNLFYVEMDSRYLLIDGQENIIRDYTSYTSQIDDITVRADSKEELHNKKMKVLTNLKTQYEKLEQSAKEKQEEVEVHIRGLK